MFPPPSFRPCLNAMQLIQNSHNDMLHWVEIFEHFTGAEDLGQIMSYRPPPPPPQLSVRGRVNSTQVFIPMKSSTISPQGGGEDCRPHWRRDFWIVHGAEELRRIITPPRPVQLGRKERRQTVFPLNSLEFKNLALGWYCTVWLYSLCPPFVVGQTIFLILVHT